VRAARLLSIQMLLETRGLMSARALADTLRTSIRTLHRDIDHLSAAGVPVLAERGRLGGFRLLEGWRTQLTGLTPSEAQAVFLSGLAGPAEQLGMRSSLQSAQLKVLTSLPAPLREHASVVAKRLHLDPVDWYKKPDPAPQLAMIAEAVWSGRKLAFRYRSWKGLASRVVDPLGIVLKAGTWYFVGLAEGDPRTYRVAGVLEGEILAERVRRPRGFDLARYWQGSVTRFEREIYTGTARVLATAEGLDRLRELSAAAAQAVDDARPEKTGERTSVAVPIESSEIAARQLLALAPEVEVLEPQSLRRAIREKLRKVARLYR